MRHGSLPAGPITLLAEGVPPGSLGGLLVSFVGRLFRLYAADGRADWGAIPLPPIASTADPDLLPTQIAMKDPMALFDGSRTWGTTLALDKCGKRANTLWQLSCRAA